MKIKHPAAFFAGVFLLVFCVPALVLALLENEMWGIPLLSGVWIVWILYGNFAKPGTFGAWTNDLWIRFYGKWFWTHQVVAILVCLVPYIILLVGM